MLDDHVVIVTGAGKGLGKAYALHLAAAGAKVVVNNRRHPGEDDSATSAMQTVNEIRRRGGIAEPNYLDVSDAQSGSKLVEHALHAFGNLHGVVANAGVESIGRFETLDNETFSKIFNTSFFGTLYLVQAAWGHWLSTGYGRAVLTTSGAGLYGNHGQTAYSAAKAAIIGLVKSLALEGASKNIRVNAIAPYAATAMTNPFLSDVGKRLLAPEKVAPVVQYLLSPDCSLAGDVVVTGGGVARRAAFFEGPLLTLEDVVPQTVAALSLEQGHSFNSASASFEHLYNTLIEGIDENTFE